MTYEKLFSPAKIGPVEIKNRLVMSPMGTGIANMDGTPTDAIIKWYEERAIGGCGLIYTEVCRVNDFNGPTLLRQLALTKDSQVGPMSKLVDTVHKHGTKIFCQLHHPGRQTHVALCAEPNVVSASAIPCKHTKEPTRALETAEVKGIIQNYIQAAVRAKKAGFDGVEVHGGHGYLPQQFLSPYTNKRTDEYGGSFENRMRFCAEIVAGIHAACGDDFPVTLRMPGDELLDECGVTEPYIDNAEAVKIAVAMEKAGYNALNVTVGSYEARLRVIDPAAYAQGWRSVYVKPIKDAVSIPVIAVNHVREPEVAEQLLQDGVQDFIAMGRTWIADPQWGVKVMEGRTADIRKCIGCVNCFGSLEANALNGTPPDCSVNPRAFKEVTLPEPVRVTEERNVVVVGAGPAGMAAALTCAQRGMNVTLLEKSARLGGLVNYASASPVKSQMHWLIDWYEKQLPENGVNICLNTEATVETVAALKPDAVIVASGAKPIVPNSIPGTDGENVFNIYQVLDGVSGLENKKVVIAGAGITGLECGEYLNGKGCETIIVDMTEVAAPNDYRDIVNDDCNRLKAGGTKFMLKHALKEVRADGVVLHDMDADADVVVDCDAVVLSLGLTPENGIFETLKAHFDNVYSVGGVADVAGKIPGATNSAYRCALHLFEEEKKGSSLRMKPADMENFCPKITMRGQEGVFVAFLTDMEAVQRILPPPLKPFRMPVVTVSVCHITEGADNVSADYYETIVNVYATYNGQVGAYNMALILDGYGHEGATVGGREFYGFAKKLGGQFYMDKKDDKIKIRVARKGSTIVDIDAKIGEYNSLLTHAIYSGAGAGKQTTGNVFCYKFDIVNNDAQHTEFADARMLVLKSQYDYKDWQPANCKLELHSSPDDPWGELPVRTVIGGAYNKNDLTLNGVADVVPVDANEVVPYLLSSRYDRLFFGDPQEI